MENNVINTYKQNADAALAEANNYKALANRYSLMRLAVFALMGITIYMGAVQNNFTLIVSGFLPLLLAFTWLVSRQSKYEQQRKYYQDLQRVNQNEIASITSRGNLYDNGSRYYDEKHFYTSDLDIFGSASLYQFINRAATSLGNNKLATWLSAPATKPVILSRQQAVTEIADKMQWKLETQTLLLFANGTDINQLQRLFTYLQTPLNLPGEKWLRAYIKIAPYLLLAAITGSFFVPWFKLVAILLAAANLVIISSKGSYIIKSSFIADKISEVLAAYASVFNKIENENWQSPYCAALARQIKDKQTSKNIAVLAKLINKLGYNLIMIVGFILNVFFLWALKQIIAIEDWKRANQESLESAFEVIAEFEAVMSLAGLRVNYPEWTMPQIADGNGYTLAAEDMAHPLISENNRVVNDYELNNAFKIDIITGSNMAGKSTFLRTAGINTVLALSGAPVCAKAMQVSVMTIVSYMRIKDSLNESTSTFKAELDRLQMLLGAVQKEYKVFFLIDEMLRGTNSVDKYLGSKAVIEQLIKKRGVGLVATHDLQIALLEQKYPDYVRNFYFDIQVVDGEMLFDYKMKHGECKTFNASLLLKRIGIDVESE